MKILTQKMKSNYSYKYKLENYIAKPENKLAQCDF